MNYNNAKGLNKLYSKLELVLYAALCLSIMLGVSYFYLVHLSHQQQQQDSAQAEKLLTSVTAEIGSATGVMSSLTSVQQILDDPLGNTLDLFANKSLEQSQLITNVGLYERIEVKELVDYSQSMSESILYNFMVRTLDENGNRVPIQVKDHYYPLIWRQPYNPRSAMLIGIDLDHNEAMKNAIRLSESNNIITATPTPPNWSTSEVSDILIIRPSYFGRFAPESGEELSSQSNGGVLIGLDIAGYVAKNDLLAAGSRFQIQISNPDDTHHAKNAHRVRTINAELEDPRYLTSLFKSQTFSNMPIAGSDILKITVESKGGIPLIGLVKTASLILGTAMMLLLSMRLMHKLRYQEAIRIKERESALVTLRAIGDSVITTDEKGIINYANPSTEKLLNIRSEDITGQHIGDVVIYSSQDLRKPLRTISDYIEHGREQESTLFKLPELNLQTSDGSELTVAGSVSPMGADESSSTSGHVLVMRDITSERALTKELEFLATHDSLTKIANRYSLEKQLNALFDSGKTRNHAICFIDLDQFKTINDTCGHSAGDELLSRVSTDLKAITRKSDLISRLGGDEFGLLINDCDKPDAIELAQRVYDYFQTLYFEHKGDVFAVRASIGFVHFTQQFESIEEVMAAADLACYSAKDSGRNELCIYNNNIDTTDRRREMMWLPKLQMALQCDNFRLFVQPIVPMETAASISNFTHYEILLRLQLDDGTLITPAQLIIAAERYQLMKDIDRWVISNAIDTIARLTQELGADTPKFSINLSGQSCIDNELAAFIKNKIQTTGVNADSLIFEITETAAITNMKSAVDLVEALHEVGCKLALDDFGSGMSSFGYLKTFPVDYLKIDGQFIKNINDNEVDKEMVKCIQTIADILGIETIAEFVENGEIIEVLRELNVGYGQGYYYSRPHSIDDLFIDNNVRKAA